MAGDRIPNLALILWQLSPGLALLLAYRWSAKPAFLRHSLWIVVPLVVLTFFLGYLD